ncbi:DUF5994 family protein [Nocardia otitidiscaviarum]|uniref:DUF5994 family protein n=1 Tax=Nocardia otitidiscaviarum TaxID=1823 RepID=UPI001895F494|nr:DUF5994 family protein [Nocardia otitidiscaviarum]MBF6181537.1 hypothetical protein [Nocardia otitidiscaviarum]
MTSQPTDNTTRRPTFSGRPPRLQLETPGTRTIDGYWRPYGRDLAAELPGLLAALTPRLGPIHRVVYHLDEWASAPRKLDFGGRRVRLDGYRHSPARTVEILGVAVGAKLVLRTTPAVDTTDMATAQQRWDSEGGAGADREADISARDRAMSRPDR